MPYIWESPHTSADTKTIPIMPMLHPVYQENYINTVAADALAPSVARSSAATILTIWKWDTLVVPGMNLNTLRRFIIDEWHRIKIYI